MCPVWEFDNNLEDPAVSVRCCSSEQALNYIMNVKRLHPHLRLQYDAKHTLYVWNFNSDAERTFFIIKADTYK